MSSEAPAAAPAPEPPPRRRSRLRGLWIALAVVLVLALAVVGAVTWLLGTSTGARMALERVTRMTGGGVTFEGVEGRIGGLLRIKAIEVNRPDMYARVDDLEMDTSPLDPLRGRLVVHRLAARAVEVRTVDTGAAAKIPASFAPPYPVRLDEGVVGEFRSGDLPREAAAEKDPARKKSMMIAARGNDLVVKNIFLKGEGDQKEWRIAEARAETAYGKARLAGRLESAAPFAIDVTLGAEGVAAERPYRADVAAKGTLKSMQATLDGEVSGQRATGKATLEPFSTVPLRSLELQARDVDLSQHAPGPRTRLSLDVRLAAQSGAFAGPIRIENAAPGPWDRKAVPVTAASARVVVTTERLDVADLHLALLGGGSATGRATLQKSGVEADLRVADVDLSALHRELQKTRVTGRVSVAGDRAAQRFEVSLKDPRFGIDGRASLAAQRLDVESVRIATGGGAVTAKGTMALAGGKDFRFEGRAERFDPSAFVKTTKGDLNFAFVATGNLAAGVAGEARLEIAPSTYAGLPAQGRVLVAGDAKRIANADVDVTLGEARLTARGSFGREGDAMDVTFRVPNLAAVARPFGVQAAGRAQGEGRLTGTFKSPAGRVSLTGADLALPSNVFVKELALRAEAGVDPESAIDASVQARGISMGEDKQPPRPFADAIAATVKGTRAAHRLDVTADMTRETRLTAAFRGGLDPRAKEAAWSGRLEAFGMTGRGAFALQGPADLYLAASRVELGEARLKGEWGEAHFGTTRWTPRTLDFKGSTPGIEIQNLARSFRMTTMPRSNLVIAGDWEVHSAETFNGRVNFRRVSGDLRVGEPPLPLGLQEMVLKADVVRGRVDANLALTGERVGRIEGRGTGSIVRGASGWEFAANAPIEARLVADHTNLEALAPWLGPDSKLGGKVNAVVSVSGTGADPRVAGEARATGLVVREPQTGFEVEQGEVVLRMSGKSVTVERFEAVTPWRPSRLAREQFEGMTLPERGTVTAQGSIDLGARTGTMRFKADHAVITQLPSRFLAISGEAQLQAGADGLLATGAFKADAGWVGALDTPLPSVSEDVVVVRASRPAPAEAAPKGGEKIRIDLRVALGEQVHFTGRGLDTRLAGEVQITGTPGAALKATGSIRTVGGTYKGYGQNLAIERGVLQFSGPLDNPLLNVLAVRKGLAVEPGVEVTGTATRPRVRLVSTPDVPEPEKLSWLVLGRGPSELAPGDASVLLAAATSMLGGNNPGSDLGKKFGLDEVKIGRADANSILGVLPQSTVAGKTGSASAAEVVSVGKKLGRNFHLTYEQGLADAEGALKVTWQITRQFQMLVRAGYLPGLDAVYRWTFK
ncbi:MAG TPA: translocation/assembly module TamB domain-containing protein [Usitatibacter sp.]|nr:translocation/assembly module TamB domain-containing protein [Usitatibacter sp.]